MNLQRKLAVSYQGTYVGVVYTIKNKSYVITDDAFRRLNPNLQNIGYVNAKLGSDNLLYLEDQPKNCTYIRVFDPAQLQSIGILFVTNINNNVSASILNYINSRNPKFKIQYRCGDEVIDDKTDRTLGDVLNQGYRGNRLDVMIKSYDVYLIMGKMELEIARRQNNQLIFPYNYNRLLFIASQIDKKEYVDVCSM